jgi:DUF2993 family protein
MVRLLGALTAALVFLAVFVLLAGELWIRPAVEDQIGKGVADELDLTETPDVEVKGFPLVLRAMQERLDGIEISVEGQVFEGLRVRDVDLHVDDVRFKSSELLRRGGTIVISGGGGHADIADSDLTAFLHGTGLPVDVTFDAGSVRVRGEVTISGVTVDASVTGELALDGVALRFTPTVVDVGQVVDASVDISALEAEVRRQFAFTAPVPELQGVHLTAVQIGDGVASIDASFGTLTVEY